MPGHVNCACDACVTAATDRYDQALFDDAEDNHNEKRMAREQGWA